MANRVAAIVPHIDPIRKASIELTSQCNLLSRRQANTDIQYLPHSVETDIDCGPRFADTVSEISIDVGEGNVAHRLSCHPCSAFLKHAFREVT